MTDEERRKLCEWLHRGSVGWNGSQIIEPKMAQAADEIERLSLELREAERVFASMEKENKRLSWNYAGRRND